MRFSALTPTAVAMGVLSTSVALKVLHSLRHRLNKEISSAVVAVGGTNTGVTKPDEQRWSDGAGTSNAPRPILLDLEVGVLEQVFSHLDVQSVASIGLVCRALHELEVSLRDGHTLHWVQPTINKRLSDPVRVYDVDGNLVTKNVRPGMSFIVCSQPADLYSSYWELQLASFTGHRCEVGLCSSAAITSTGLDKGLHTWYFDCFGRKFHNQVHEEYGGKLRTGDILGVLYNKRERTISFYENGKDMGVAYHNVSARTGRLLMFCALPHWPGEQVKFLSSPSRPRELYPTYMWSLSPQAEASRVRYTASAHPHDGMLLVRSFLNQMFLLPIDPEVCTVEELKQQLSAVCGYPAEHIALRCVGKLLQNPQAVLSEVGIRFGTLSKTQTQDILMYIPLEIG